MNNKKILITGGKGILGKGLTELFKKNNYTNIYSYGREFDVTNTELVKQKLQELQPDIIIHAAVEGGRRTKEDTVDVFNNNLKGFYNIFTYYQKYCKSAKFINFTSAAEYDTKQNINIGENEPLVAPQTHDFYGFSKFLITYQLRAINDKDCFNLRLFNVFGPTEESDRFITTCIKKALKNEDIIIFQNKRFSFFYIEDLFKIIKGIIDNKIKNNEINCVYSQPMSLCGIANLIIKLTKSKSNVRLNGGDGFDYCGTSKLVDSLHLDGIQVGMIKMIQHIDKK